MQLDSTLAGEGTQTLGRPPCSRCGHMPTEHPVKSWETIVDIDGNEFHVEVMSCPFYMRYE